MEIVLGDITKIKADAIVNAANTQLKHGGGVARAIVQAGGEIIQKESNDIGECIIGKAVVTGAGKLPAKIVIHVPTIDNSNGKKADLEDIKKGVAAAFEIAKNTKCKTITFPLLGAGVVGLPSIEVARAMKEATDTISEIQSILIVHSQEEYDSLKYLF
ncbi:macro domain-containing protein [Patescibacteria group bacterium]|nr:macro domain-containing protein [Patescibacteria group bacterium]